MNKCLQNSSSNKLSLKRYIKDLKDLIDESYKKNNIIYKVIMLEECSFIVVINGPKDTPYSGGYFSFKISITANNNYPYKPPKVTLNTKIFHPNVDKDGNICLDIIGKNWSPTLNFRTLVLSLSSFLEDPNPEDPLYIDAATLYTNNREEYEKKVIEYTQKYASITELDKYNTK